MVGGVAFVIDILDFCYFFVLRLWQPFIVAFAICFLVHYILHLIKEIALHK